MPKKLIKLLYLAAGCGLEWQGDGEEEGEGEEARLVS